jgi:Fe-S oxidoreductase
MPHNREEAKCCGRFLLRYPKYGMGIQLDRLNEAIATGASALICTCPTCETNFRIGVKEAGSALEVFDITDFVCQSVGIPTMAVSKFMKLGII